MAIRVVLFMMLLYASAVALAADNRNPFAGNAKAAKAGASEFRINCALCHGLGGRGGGRGPDLTRAQKKHAHSDAEMFQIISNGIPGTAMPANGTNGQGVGMTDEEIWQIITYIRSQEVKAPAQQIGNVGHGKELFYGDIDYVRNPSAKLAWGLTEATKEFPQEYESVTLVTSDGKEIKGITLNEDSFSVQVMDSSEQIHLLEKGKLRSFQKSRQSAMPRYGADILSDKDLGDIVAYLISVGAK